ncbi:MAG TPA: AarF/UbiB family protein, partial [Spirochaetota bacterium]|nr:AarF/UbiB family protein [Spirochaetota bacterium]
KLRKKYGFQVAQKKMEKIHKRRADKLYELAIELGGVHIKMCQYLSTRRDIFPEPYIEKLSLLQDAVPPVSFSVIQKIINEQYKDGENPFSYIDEKPLASASLGQTHKGILKTGEEVAVKFLKPDIEKIIDVDFAILFYVFKLFSNFKIFRDQADFSNVLEEFIKVTGDELNFKREIYISKKFKTALRKYPYIKVPYVYEEHSRNKIIVMEFIDGVKITDKEKWAKKNNDSETLARRLVEIYVEQFLFLKIIHFDPHPGNIFVLENNNIALIDFGMSGEITELMSKNIKDGLNAFITKDYLKLLKVIESMGFIKKGTDLKKFIPIFEYFFDEVLESVDLERNSIQNVDLTPVIDDLVEIIYTQPIKLPYEWAYIGRTVGTLTGIISILNPQFKIYEEMKPYFDKFLRENFNDIVERSIDNLKFTAKEILSLPSNVNNFVTKVERGTLKFQVDLDEIDERIIDISFTTAKSFGFVLSFFSFAFSFSFYFFGNKIGAYIFGGISVVFFIFSLFYRKRLSKKELIKKSIFK